MKNEVITRPLSQENHNAYKYKAKIDHWAVLVRPVARH
jgi:hypothetical protein